MKKQEDFPLPLGAVPRSKTRCLRLVKDETQRKEVPMFTLLGQGIQALNDLQTALQAAANSVWADVAVGAAWLAAAVVGAYAIITGP